MARRITDARTLHRAEDNLNMRAIQLEIRESHQHITDPFCQLFNLFIFGRLLKLFKHKSDNTIFPLVAAVIFTRWHALFYQARFQRALKRGKIGMDLGIIRIHVRAESIPIKLVYHNRLLRDRHILLILVQRPVILSPGLGILLSLHPHRFLSRFFSEPLKRQHDYCPHTLFILLIPIVFVRHFRQYIHPVPLLDIA